eukprot:9370292-Alexandrium_andersonii.AAC.1
MSASLVGSEMCIRDSPEVRQPTAQRLELRHSTRVARGSREGHCTWNPVSYTHLTLPTICSV